MAAPRRPRAPNGAKKTPRAAAAPPPPGRARRARRRRVIALTGVNALIGRNLVGLYEEDPRVGKIVALDVALPQTAGAKTRFYKPDLTNAGVGAPPRET